MEPAGREMTDAPRRRIDVLRIPAPCHLLLRRKLIRAEPDSGSADLEFDARPEFENGLGKIQGGFVAAMLDSVMGAALSTVLMEDEAPPTLELKVSFVRGAEVGRLLGHGRVVHKGRSAAFVEAELRNPRGQLLATSTATAHIIRLTAPQAR